MQNSPIRLRAEKVFLIPMQHAHRFYVSPESLQKAVADLPLDEAHHARHVLRLRAGERVELFDGTGNVATGTLLAVNNQGVHVDVESRQTVAPPAKNLVLVQAALNREKNLETVLQRATELGVAEVRVFRGEHSERAPRARDKWRRLAIESCKQCGRAFLPSFSAHPGLEAAIAGLNGALVVAALDRSPVPVREAVSGAVAAAVIVGPEGDLSTSEVDRAIAAGAKPVSLGPYVLRSEVAATVACVLVGDALGLLDGGARDCRSPMPALGIFPIDG